MKYEGEQDTCDTTLWIFKNLDPENYRSLKILMLKL